MNSAMQKIKDFDSAFGWIIRWAIMMLVAYAVLFADTRYLKRDEVEKYMQEFHKMRSDDMASIYSSIERVKAEAITATERNRASVLEADKVARAMEGRLARIEAQNEIIIKSLERMDRKAHE